MTIGSQKGAFTIIENLIIIILIILTLSGIFFAKKILKESDVKSLIMQIKKYDAALNSFTQKYHALPGDIEGTQTYGLTQTNTDGDGDNVITDKSRRIFQANGEIANFWMHLSKSKMLDENYEGEKNSHAKIKNTFPISKIGEKIGIVAFGAEGKTFYQVGFESADSKRLYMTNHSLKADEAFLFDAKIDDGFAQRGRVVAVGGNVLNQNADDNCVKFEEYNQDYPEPVCQIRIEAR